MDVHARPSRRQFVKRTLVTTGTLGLTAASGQPAGRDRKQVDSGSLNKFRAQLKGGLITPTDPGYEAARRVYFWNPATERHPAVIARCVHADDVRRAVEFARTHGLEVAVRGGGHSILGWGASHGLVIDLTGMKRLSIDPARRIGRVDAGVSGAEVVRSAGRYGLAPVLGQCPDVGAAGITLGGGLGWLSGLHGASCDNLVSARIVAPNGAILPVDAERNPELLWGLRGAGANFGVATSLELRLHPVETVTAGDIYYPAREARPVLRFFRTLMAEAPDSFQATINLTTGARGVFIMLCHAGSGVEAERLCRNLRTVATPSRDTIRRQRFAELADQKYVASSVDANFRYVTTAYRNQLSGEVVDAALDSLSGAPPEMVLGISHYLHGEVCRVAPDSTAFPLREQGGIHIRASVDWNDPAAAPRLMRWADEVRRRLRPASGERIYANYQSYDGQGSAEAVFGANLARLAALKNRYDPANLFRRNSNIEPRQA